MDRFRIKQKLLHPSNYQLTCEIKTKAQELCNILELVSTREMSLAITNLEQAVMWAVKAIAIQDERHNEPIRDLY